MHYARGLHIHSSKNINERGLHMYTLVKSCITNEDSTYTRQVVHYERGLHMYTLVKSCITNEDSTYTRQVMHYERGLHMYTLVRSCIRTKTTYTRKVVLHVYTLVKSRTKRTTHALLDSSHAYERGLHIHSSSHALRTRTPHTLVKSYITNEDSHTRIHSSSDASSTHLHS